MSGIVNDDECVYNLDIDFDRERLQKIYTRQNQAGNVPGNTATYTRAAIPVGYREDPDAGYIDDLYRKSIESLRIPQPSVQAIQFIEFGTNPNGGRANGKIIGWHDDTLMFGLQNVELDPDLDVPEIRNYVTYSLRKPELFSDDVWDELSKHPRIVEKVNKYKHYLKRQEIRISFNFPVFDSDGDRLLFKVNSFQVKAFKHKTPMLVNFGRWHKSFPTGNSRVILRNGFPYPGGYNALITHLKSIGLGQ